MFSPKNLLRHPLAKSPLAEFSETASDKDPNIQVGAGAGSVRVPPWLPRAHHLLGAFALGLGATRAQASRWGRGRGALRGV